MFFRKYCIIHLEHYICFFSIGHLRPGFSHNFQNHLKKRKEERKTFSIICSDSLLLRVENIFLSASAKVGERCEARVICWDLTADWAMTPSCVITSSSLWWGIQLPLFQLGNFPCCCEKDDEGIIFSTVNHALAGMHKVKTACQQWTLMFFSPNYLSVLRYYTVLWVCAEHGVSLHTTLSGGCGRTRGVRACSFLTASTGGAINTVWMCNLWVNYINTRLRFDINLLFHNAWTYIFLDNPVQWFSKWGVCPALVMAGQRQAGLIY